MLNELGIARGDCDRLHEVPADRLAAAIAPASRAVGRPALPLLDRYDFGPAVDGTDLPAQPFDPAAPEIARDIPLLIGGTREESGFFLADDDEVWERRVTRGLAAPAHRRGRRGGGRTACSTCTARCGPARAARTC